MSTRSQGCHVSEARRLERQVWTVSGRLEMGWIRMAQYHRIAQLHETEDGVVMVAALSDPW